MIAKNKTPNKIKNNDNLKRVNSGKHFNYKSPGKIMSIPNSNPSILMTSPKDNIKSNRVELNEIKDLSYNHTDDYRQLVLKNKRLFLIVNDYSNKYKEMNELLKKSEENQLKEKEELLNKLDKISSNYKVFADSHKNYSQLKIQYEEDKKDLEKISDLNKDYEKIIRILLSEFLQNFKKIQNLVMFNITEISAIKENLFHEILDILKNTLENFSVKLQQKEIFNDYLIESKKIIDNKNNVFQKSNSVTTANKIKEAKSLNLPKSLNPNYRKKSFDSIIKEVEENSTLTQTINPFSDAVFTHKFRYLKNSRNNDSNENRSPDNKYLNSFTLSLELRNSRKDLFGESPFEKNNKGKKVYARLLKDYNKDFGIMKDDLVEMQFRSNEQLIHCMKNGFSIDIPEEILEIFDDNSNY